MNLFRLCGDVSHVVSIVVLALRLNATKSAVGISLKTHVAGHVVAFAFHVGYY